MSPAKQAEAEARMRAQVAMAAKRAQDEAARSREESLRAEVARAADEAARERQAQVVKAEDRRALRTGPPPPQAVNQQQQPATAQRQRQLMQQKINAIKPAPPPQAGMPKVVATVLVMPVL